MYQKNKGLVYDACKSSILSADFVCCKSLNDITQYLVMPTFNYTWCISWTFLYNQKYKNASPAPGNKYTCELINTLL